MPFFGKGNYAEDLKQSTRIREATQGHGPLRSSEREKHEGLAKRGRGKRKSGEEARDPDSPGIA